MVLDPFTGSGSTGKAAVLEDSRFASIEREQSYFEIATRRVEDAVRRRDGGEVERVKAFDNR